MGFFVYRHLGLARCNIGYMKRFLPLLMFTGLLFGQDGLILKSGEVYNGTFIRIVDELIVFQVEGENDSTKFPINDVAIIKTSDGELTYPFIPNYNLKNQQQKFVKKAGTIILGALGCSLIFKFLVIKYLEELIGPLP